MYAITGITGQVGGAVARRLLDTGGTVRAVVRVVNVEGPSSVSPLDLARAFADALGHDVGVEPVPRAAWEATFRAKGAKYPEPRARMIDGFNEGWITFDAGGGESIRGAIPLQVVIAGLVKTNAVGG